MKRTIVDAKEIRGKASETPRRGPSRIKAAALDSNICTFRDLTLRVNRYLRHNGRLGESTGPHAGAQASPARP
jgi:hypothetical protein